MLVHGMSLVLAHPRELMAFLLCKVKQFSSLSLGTQVALRPPGPIGGKKAAFAWISFAGIPEVGIERSLRFLRREVGHRSEVEKPASLL